MEVTKVSALSTINMNSILMTFLISMVPIVELRGAIPIGVAAGLSIKTAIIISVIGNLIPVPFIILFIKRIFAWMRKVNPKLDGLVTHFENKAEEKSDVVKKYALLGLVLFVGIPLPGTGAWTGSLIAAMLNMPVKRSAIAISIGVVMAGIIISFATYGVGTMWFGL